MKGKTRAHFLGLATLLCFYLSIACADAQYIYVANWGDNTIAKLDANGSGSVFAHIPINNFSGLAFDHSGNLYVASSNSIVRFDPNGNSFVFANSYLSTPAGLAFDTNGNLFVANWGNNTIAKFDANGNGSIFTSTNVYLPVGLAFDTNGNLYVSNMGSAPGIHYGSIEKFDSNAHGSVFAADDGLRDPAGLAFDHAGNLYVGVLEGGGIGKYDPTGNWSIFADYRSGELDPFGLAFDSSGYLYVANYGYGTIGKLDLSGHQSIFASGLSLPVGIAVGQTPFAIWQLAEFGTNASNPAISGDMADPDGDGIANLLEYAMNLDPNTASATGLPTGQIDPGCGCLTLIYTKVLSATDIHYTPEATEDLNNSWSTNGVTQSVIASNAVTQTIRASDTLFPVASFTNRFMHLKVTRTP